MSERLRSWARNPMGFARRGSNPLGVDALLRFIRIFMGWVLNLCGRFLHFAEWDFLCDMYDARGI